MKSPATKSRLIQDEMPIPTKHETKYGAKKMIVT